MMPDNRSPLMKRLAEIMPKRAADRATDAKFGMPVELHPIRMSADSFASWIGDDLPADRNEMLATLWVFGEILDGEMERQMNTLMRLHGNLMDMMPIPTQTFHPQDTRNAI
jgi:hypothetical protein